MVDEAKQCVVGLAARAAHRFDRANSQIAPVARMCSLRRQGILLPTFFDHALVGISRAALGRRRGSKVTSEAYVRSERSQSRSISKDYASTIGRTKSPKGKTTNFDSEDKPKVVEDEASFYNLST